LAAAVSSLAAAAPAAHLALVAVVPASETSFGTWDSGKQERQQGRTAPACSRDTGRSGEEEARPEAEAGGPAEREGKRREQWSI